MKKHILREMKLVGCFEQARFTTSQDRNKVILFFFVSCGAVLLGMSFSWFKNSPIFFVRNKKENREGTIKSNRKIYSNISIYHMHVCV